MFYQSKIIATLVLVSTDVSLVERLYVAELTAIFIAKLFENIKE